jgi:hypothetical protein
LVLLHLLILKLDGLLVEILGPEALAHGTVHLLVSLFVALGAKLEVLGPLVVSLVSGRPRATILALDAVHAFELLDYQVELFAYKFSILRLGLIQRLQSLLVRLRQTAVMVGRVADSADHQGLFSQL